MPHFILPTPSLASLTCACVPDIPTIVTAWPDQSCQTPHKPNETQKFNLVASLMLSIITDFFDSIFNLCHIVYAYNMKWQSTTNISDFIFLHMLYCLNIVTYKCVGSPLPPKPRQGHFLMYAAVWRLTCGSLAISITLAIKHQDICRYLPPNLSWFDVAIKE